MRLICPSCGAVASADTFANDDLCRQTLAKVAGLPGPLPQATLGYISLFRTGAARALSWKKALRLVSELEVLVTKGYVHVQGKADKSCHPSTWAKGMEQMVEQRPFLRLPMESHVYLQKVVWDLADKADSQQESGQHQHSLKARRPDHSIADPERDPTEKARREYDAKHGAPQRIDSEELLRRIGGIGNAE